VGTPEPLTPVEDRVLQEPYLKYFLKNIPSVFNVPTADRRARAVGGACQWFQDADRGGATAPGPLWRARRRSLLLALK
jgi:hypothetical protein